MPHPEAGGYTPVAKALHWLVALLLGGQYAVAWTMPHIGRNTRPETLINLHFSLGVLILTIVVIRLVTKTLRASVVPGWNVVEI